jgi:GNAT superfamily N-acetyltransferase
LKDLIVLRPATADDEAFVNDLLFTTMHEYVEATWPNDPVAHQHYYQINQCDPSNTRIIQLDGKDVGRLSTTVRADCVFIDEIHILPEYQGRGVATNLVEQIFKEAREKGLPVNLTVLTVNHRAQNLYGKMGFKVIGEKEHRMHMQYLPEGYESLLAT